MSTIEQRDRFRFGRSDRWVLWLLLGVIAAGSVVGLVLEPLRRWATGDSVPVSYDGRFTAAALDRAGVGYDVDAATANVPGDGLIHLLDLVPGLLTLVVLAIGGLQLVGIVRSIAGGNPFDPRNVRRLRIIAALCAVGGAAVPFVRAACSMAAADHAGLGSLLRPDGFSVHLSFVPFVAMLLVALLAEAFATGSRMREDLDGVI